MRSSSGSYLRLASCLVPLAACGRLGFEALTAGDGDGGLGGDAPDGGFAVLFPNQGRNCAVAVDTTLSMTPLGWSTVDTPTFALDPSAPSQGPAVAVWSWPIGEPGGDAPWGLVSPLIGAGRREIYVGMVWKVSDPWDGHASTFNNILYVHFDDASTLAIGSFTMLGTDPPYRLAAALEGLNLSANVNDPEIVLGAWHVLELRVRMSTTRTSGDGMYAWWLDGTSVGLHTNLSFDVDNFEDVRVSPTWGGTGDVKQTADSLSLDRIVLCEEN